MFVLALSSIVGVRARGYMWCSWDRGSTVGAASGAEGVEGAGGVDGAECVAGAAGAEAGADGAATGQGSTNAKNKGNAHFSYWTSYWTSKRQVYSVCLALPSLQLICFRGSTFFYRSCPCVRHPCSPLIDLGMVL
jgi:hypothetical protein